MEKQTKVYFCALSSKPYHSMVDPKEGKKNENTIRKCQYQYLKNADTSAASKNDLMFWIFLYHNWKNTKSIDVAVNFLFDFLS